MDDKALELSDAMKGKLAEYAIEFTRPLILSIFRRRQRRHRRHGKPAKHFHDPDVARVRARLKRMAEKTGIPVGEIPAFLKNYGDLFLSGAPQAFERAASKGALKILLTPTS